MILTVIPTVAILSFVGWFLGLVVNWLADQLPSIGQPAGEQNEISESLNVPPTSIRARLGAPRCSKCDKRRHILGWSGIVSLLARKTKCDQCGNRLSIRNALVEAWMAVALSYVFLRFELTSLFVVYGCYLIIFTLIAIIDIEHRYILNIVIIPAFAFALVEVFVSGRVAEPRASLAGYAVAQIGVMAIYLFGGAYLWLVNRRRKDKVEEVAFGFGDVTLATFCGLLVGSPDVIDMLILMVFVGAVISIGYFVVRAIVRREFKSHIPVAYGPAILISAAAMLLWRESVVALLHAGR